MPAFFDRILRAGEGRLLRELGKVVAIVNGHEARISALSDADLRAQTALFQKRISEGESLDELLPEAFAVVREAAQRTLGQRHYDVQLMGGAALHRGNIGNAYRRRQDSGCNPTFLSQRFSRTRRARCHN